MTTSIVPSLETTRPFLAPLKGNICILALRAGGNGDYSYAMKVACALHDRLKIPLTSIILIDQDVKKISEADRNELPFEQFNKKRFTHIHSRCEKDHLALLKEYSCILQIIVPLPKGIDPLTYNTEHPPTLVFCEYGTKFTNGSDRQLSQTFEVYHLGLDKGELGICLSETLFQNYDRANRESIVKNSYEKIDPSFRDFLMEGRNCPIYFGYANKPMGVDEEECPLHFRLSFIKAIIRVKKIQEVIFVLPGGKINLEHSSTEWVEGQFAKTRVEKRSFTFSDCRITLIVGKLSPDDFLNLFSISEPECLVTGDQSLSEAISANKRFAYQQLSHKSELGHALNQLYQFPISIDEKTTENSIVEKMCQIFTKMEFSKVNFSICQNFDALAKICDLTYSHLK